MSEGLRNFIRNLEEAGELLRIKEEVDWNLEIGAITCRIHDRKGPALLFEKIKDVSQGYQLLTAPYGTYGRYALGLGLPKDASPSEIIGEYRQRIKYPIKPMLLDKAPCKENIFLDKEADLFKLPLPKWHSRDRGRFLGTLCAVITKDLETDWVNVGMYRMMVHDNYSTGIAIGSWNHGGQIYQKYEKRGEPMPMAVCIGVEPVIHFVAVASFAYGVNELDMAGALKRAPVELVRCETMDFYVPNAEIVVEGVVPPKERKIDYPFGEYTGTYGGDPVDPMPVFRVKAITHRNNPIATGTLEKILPAMTIS